MAEGYSEFQNEGESLSLDELRDRTESEGPTWLYDYLIRMGDSLVESEYKAFLDKVLSDDFLALRFEVGRRIRQVYDILELDPQNAGESLRYLDAQTWAYLKEYDSATWEQAAVARSEAIYRAVAQEGRRLAEFAMQMDVEWGPEFPEVDGLLARRNREISSALNDGWWLKGERQLLQTRGREWYSRTMNAVVDDGKMAPELVERLRNDDVLAEALGWTG